MAHRASGEGEFDLFAAEDKQWLAGQLGDDLDRVLEYALSLVLR